MWKSIVLIFALFCVAAHADEEGNAKWTFGNCGTTAVVDDRVYDKNFGECFLLYNADGTPTGGASKLIDCTETYIEMKHYEVADCTGDPFITYKVNTTCADEADDLVPHIRIFVANSVYECSKTTVTGDTSISTVAIILIAAGTVAILASGLYCLLCIPTGRARRL